MIRVWKGIHGIRDLIKKTVRDSGFDTSREAGFAKIGYGMRDSNRKRKWDAGFLQKRSGNAGAGPPLPDPE